jgi:hypothetical protein
MAGPGRHALNVGQLNSSMASARPATSDALSANGQVVSASSVGHIDLQIRFELSWWTVVMTPFPI